MKRKLSVLLAALLCTLSLASCGAPPPPAGITESDDSGGKTSGSSSSGTVDKDALRVCVDLGTAPATRRARPRKMRFIT